MSAATFPFAIVEPIRPAAPALVLAVVLPRTVVAHGVATSLAGAGVFVVFSLSLAFIQTTAGVQSDRGGSGDGPSLGRRRNGGRFAAL